jgi:hypothetical protein
VLNLRHAVQGQALKQHKQPRKPKQLKGRSLPALHLTSTSDARVTENNDLSRVLRSTASALCPQDALRPVGTGSVCQSRSSRTLS